MAASGTVVELRVHGVSGTPPEALLSCPTEFLDEVAGDKSAGFYRRQPWIEEATSGPPGAWRKVLEAYSWGGLTSGPASRAVWLLFLPFIFINLAHWMLPPATKQRFAAAVSVGLLRLIALSFTLTLMLAAAVAVMDVMVWQCMGLDYCGSTLGPLSSMASAPRGVQVALSAVPLVVVIAVLWRLGRENSRVVGRPPNPAVMAEEVPLESGSFWYNDPSVLRLRACHVMAWTAGLGALTLGVPARYAATSPVHAIGIALLAANGVVLAIAVLTTAWNRATARGGVGADWLTRPLLLARWVSLGLLVASLAWVATADIAYPTAPTHFPALRGAIYVLLGIQVVLLLGLFVFTALSVRRRRMAAAGDQGEGYRPTLGGFTSPFVALIGWLIGSGFSVGVGLWTAQALGNAVLSTEAARGETVSRAAILVSNTASFSDKAAALNADAPMIVPPPYLWAAVAIVVLIVVAVVTGVCLWWWITRRLARTELRSVLADYPGSDHTNGRAKQVAASRAWASLTDLGAPILAGLALFTVVVMLALAAWYLSDSGGFGSLPRYSPALTNASVFITASLATGLVLLAVQAFRDRQLRRVVAVLWDVITFWPRATHPLTPPCYAERTVPELLDRLRALTAADDTRVVLVAHSQGTLIAAATLLQDDERTAHRVALLTFGSPLRRLYARNFPAYFGTGALPRLRQRQRPRWINLWAYTDPIGAWVNDDRDRSMREATDEVDYRLLDVQSLAPRADGTYPPICGHSGFWTRPEYRDAVSTLESVLLPAGTATETRAAAYPTEELL
jgi:pimeloyl-ACP methyl ester carboxylesterase